MLSVVAADSYFESGAPQSHSGWESNSGKSQSCLLSVFTKEILKRESSGYKTCLKNRPFWSIKNGKEKSPY